MGRLTHRVLHASLLLSLPLALSACLGGTGPASRSSLGVLPAPRGAVAALDEHDLAAAIASGGTLLDAMRHRVPSLRVERGGQLGSCPRLRFRGVSSISLSNEPVVYVDGIRYTDACILDALHPTDVALVQVFGASESVGASASPTGMIMVYTKRE